VRGGEGEAAVADSGVREAVLDTLHRVMPRDGEGRTFEALPGAELEELIPGRLYRLAMTDPDGLPVTAQLYQGLGELGGFLWEQDVRTLLRMNAIAHPALPTVLNGGHDSDEDVGWVVTGSSDYTLAAPDVANYLPGRPIEALRHLVLLADALAILHSQGIVHRSLSPAALLVSDANHEEGIAVRLARFEMSAILQGILAGGGGAHLAVEVRQIQSGAADAVMIHHAPERLDNLLGQPAAEPEGDRSDVFSLGVIAFGWFVGSPESYAPEPGRRPVDTDVTSRRDFLLRWQRELGAAVTDAVERRGLPPLLADVLQGMLDLSPTGRPTATEVVTALTKSFTAITHDWQPGAGTRLRTMYMAAESKKTVFRWGWIANDPTGPTGRAELDEWLRSELHGARLVDSPRGALPFVRDDGDDREALLAARHVLLGTQAAWFCVRFRPKVPGGGLGAPWDELLLIKYVVPHHQLRGQLDGHRFGRDGLDLDLVGYDTSRAKLDAERPTWPSWTPLLDSVRDSGERPPDEVAFIDALRWLLEYRHAEIEGARFHFELSDAVVGDDGNLSYRTVVLAADRGARRKHLAVDSLRDFIGQQLLDLGDHLEEQNRRGDEPVKVRILGHGGEEVTGTYIGRLDPWTVKVRVERQATVPRRGTLETFENWSDRGGHQREVRAVNELLESRALLGQLRHPYTIRIRGKGLEDAGEGLEGGADEIVKRLLTSYPFFALQGPPGTGKTTVATHAVAAQLLAEPTLRVLVSAQSNGALDNLGIEIRRKLAGSSALMYRVQPRNRETVHDKLSDLDLASVTEREIARMDRTIGEVVHTQLDERIRTILSEWRGVLADSRVEMAERIRQGANVVLATTAKSTRADLDDWGRFPAFDWVIIEEAAKAWPTELAVPLVRGLRWTLIGDHKQLPAYRRADLERTLRDFAATDRPGADLLAEQADRVREAFDLLASVFERAAGRDAPVDSLRMQFRMRQTVADIVASTFYPSGSIDEDGIPIGSVETHPSAEARRNDLTAPTALVDRPLVWVDTTGSDLLDEPAWLNPGEAKLVHRIVTSLRPSRTDRDIAVLTPYVAQRDELVNSGLFNNVETVHSYQGKQADIVVVSLVRTTARGPSPTANIGFLADPQITNVLLSRAKSLLVLVGNLAHFEGAGDESWDLVTKLVRKRGSVVPYDAPTLVRNPS
jgi:serine/threonine protein kinase